MIRLDVLLNDGSKVEESVEAYEAKTFEEKLNNRESLMIAIGNTVINKSMIKLIKKSV